jgi:hypothetical protein
MDEKPEVAPQAAPDPPAEQEEQAPYVIEGARSSRSRCKTCKKKIDKGALRIGILVEGPYGTGYMWHHLKCAARRRIGDVEEAYRIEAWKEAKEMPPRLPDIEKLREEAEKASERREARKTIPWVERDPSGRARCKHCGEPMIKDSLRVVLGKEVEFGGQVRLGPMNVHPACVAEALLDEECGTEAAGLADALRANSQIANEEVEQAISEIGNLG